jgi:hypothetical protein
MNNNIDEDLIFNGPLESGIRVLCILAIDLESKFDLQQLISFDYLLIHSGDFNDAPKSLHPSNRQRNGELLIRRPLVEHGLKMMEHKKLIKKITLETGFYYQGTELACAFLESLTNEYVKMLYQRADWAVNEFKKHGYAFLSEVFDTSFKRWSSEFQTEKLNLINRTVGMNHGN